VSDRHVTFAWLDGDESPEPGTWLSQVHEVPFGATAVIASWQAGTPSGSWIEVAARGRATGADWSDWLALAVWASGDETVRPTSVAGQAAEGVRVDTDEVRIDPDAAWAQVQARVQLHGAQPPHLHRLGLMTSRLPGAVGPVSKPVLGRAVEIDVPAYSQMVHRGRHPEYGGGGQAWCSPTSVSMVLDHFGALPPADDYTWVDAGPERFVPHVARRCYDHAYQGTGNWSFNVAYAAERGLTAFATRLRSLAEAELLVAAGVPLIVSASFTADELTGAGYGTSGHLLTIVGFTEAGDPVVNDPASHELADNAQVRTTYDRAQFERVWLTGSGGLTYVLHRPDLQLPAPPAEANW